jgi:hypothetical protein
MVDGSTGTDSCAARRSLRMRQSRNGTAFYTARRMSTLVSLHPCYTHKIGKLQPEPEYTVFTCDLRILNAPVYLWTAQAIGGAGIFPFILGGSLHFWKITLMIRDVLNVDVIFNTTFVAKFIISIH